MKNTTAGKTYGQIAHEIVAMAMVDGKVNALRIGFDTDLMLSVVIKLRDFGYTLNEDFTISLTETEEETHSTSIPKRNVRKVGQSKGRMFLIKKAVVDAFVKAAKAIKEMATKVVTAIKVATVKVVTVVKEVAAKVVTAVKSLFSPTVVAPVAPPVAPVATPSFFSRLRTSFIVATNKVMAPILARMEAKLEADSVARKAKVAKAQDSLNNLKAKSAKVFSFNF